VIRAEGKNSASGLIRPFNIDTKDCPRFEWRWRVDQLQKSANLNDKKREDVAASIFLLFGDPGFMSSPEPVPTLRYVWTNEQHLKEDVIDNPYLPGVVRSIVIRTGESGRWFTESRDIKKDYENAFGEPPTEWIHAIALFTDNDQTKEPVIAYYKWARVQCTVRVYSPRTRFSVRGSLRFQINIGTLHRRGIPMIAVLGKSDAGKCHRHGDRTRGQELQHDNLQSPLSVYVHVCLR